LLGLASFILPFDLLDKALAFEKNFQIWNKSRSRVIYLGRKRKKQAEHSENI
jgi:hypothetical protein